MTLPASGVQAESLVFCALRVGLVQNGSSVGVKHGQEVFAILSSQSCLRMSRWKGGLLKLNDNSTGFGDVLNMMILAMV